MIEEYDDSPEREQRAWDKEVAKINSDLDKSRGPYVAPSYPRVDFARPKTEPCLYCAFAKKGGARGDRDHEDKGIVHKVWISHEIPTGKPCLTVWALEAACGADFRVLVDSSD